MSVLSDLEAKLVKDCSTLERVSNHPNCSEWYKDHLKTRIAFDRRMIDACWHEMPVIDRINELVRKGVLSREMCPEPHYWRWNILKPEELPQEFSHYRKLGEVRWYGN